MRSKIYRYHHWDFSDGKHVDIMQHLRDDYLAEEFHRVRHLGVTNYDTPHLQQLLEAHIPIRSNQVQYS